MVWCFWPYGYHGVVVPGNSKIAFKDQQQRLAFQIFSNNKIARVFRAILLSKTFYKFFHLLFYKISYLIKLCRLHMFWVWNAPVYKLFCGHPRAGIATAHRNNHIKRCISFYFIQAFAVVGSKIVAELFH